MVSRALTFKIVATGIAISIPNAPRSPFPRRSRAIIVIGFISALFEKIYGWTIELSRT